MPWAIQGKTLEGKEKYGNEFQGVGEKFEQMKFLAAIFEMQIMKQDTLFSFQKFLSHCIENFSLPKIFSSRNFIYK